MGNESYAIMTEVTCDLPAEYLQKNDVIAIPMNYTLDGEEYEGTIESPLSLHQFYEKLRRGILAKTTAVSPDQGRVLLEEQLKQGKDVLYLGFSSGLSSSFQNVASTREELLKRHPERKIFCVDSLCASLGQGLLVDYIVKQRAAGVPVEEAAKMAENIRLRVCHYFTVDDLNHLHRGGRVSKTTAVLGSMLGIKPVMHVDDEGHLVPHGKVRGRRQSLDALAVSMGEKIAGDYKNPYVFISHGDCEEDARYVAAKVKEKYGVPTEVVNIIGTVIGTHSGPGTVALFFIGKDRTEQK